MIFDQTIFLKLLSYLQYLLWRLYWVLKSFGLETDFVKDLCRTKTMTSEDLDKHLDIETFLLQYWDLLPSLYLFGFHHFLILVFFQLYPIVILCHGYNINHYYGILYDIKFQILHVSVNSIFFPHSIFLLLFGHGLNWKILGHKFHRKILIYKKVFEFSNLSTPPQKNSLKSLRLQKLLDQSVLAYWALLGFWVLLGPSGYFWVLLGTSGYFWILLGLTGPYRFPK